MRGGHDFVQGAASQTAPRQAGINRREAERQRAAEIRSSRQQPV
jgi:hypothetical protein